jgi:metallo-beta-lactamase family protein
MIIGYCAENTLGKKIVEKMPRVKILGEEYELKSEVAVLNSFSAHADRNELLSYLGQFDKKRMKNLFVVHGDYDQQQKLAGGLQGIGFQSITIPERGDVINI